MAWSTIDVVLWYELLNFFQKGSTSSEDMQLRAEIKQLLKEASALSQ